MSHPPLSTATLATSLEPAPAGPSRIQANLLPHTPAWLLFAPGALASPASLLSATRTRTRLLQPRPGPMPVPLLGGDCPGRYHSARAHTHGAYTHTLTQAYTPCVHTFSHSAHCTLTQQIHTPHSHAVRAHFLTHTHLVRCTHSSCAHAHTRVHTQLLHIHFLKHSQARHMHNSHTWCTHPHTVCTHPTRHSHTLAHVACAHTLTFLFSPLQALQLRQANSPQPISGPPLLSMPLTCFSLSS